MRRRMPHDMRAGTVRPHGFFNNSAICFDAHAASHLACRVYVAFENQLIGMYDSKSLGVIWSSD